LKNVITGADRVDLNGEPTGKPTDDQIADAKRRLDSYYEYLSTKDKAAAKAKTKPAIKVVDKPAIKEAPATPRRLGLADLRAAAAARKQQQGIQA
jgi:sRNA-binding protein